jgi:hypothetical protein
MNNHPIVFLVDVDDTLLEKDRTQDDLQKPYGQKRRA